MSTSVLTDENKKEEELLCSSPSLQLQMIKCGEIIARLCLFPQVQDTVGYYSAYLTD